MRAPIQIGKNNTRPRSSPSSLPRATSSNSSTQGRQGKTTLVAVHDSGKLDPKSASPSPLPQQVTIMAYEDASQLPSAIQQQRIGEVVAPVFERGDHVYSARSKLQRDQKMEVVVQVEPQHARDQGRRIRASRSATGG